MTLTDALMWTKSSYSSGEGDQCVEVATTWQKSSYSGEEGDACVEVADSAAQIHVRDSKVNGGPVLDLAPAAWAALTEWTAGTR